MSYMFCENLTEALALEARANAQKDGLLQELAAFIRTPGTIGINVQRVHYPAAGWAVEADLTYDGEVVRHYEAFDMLELELNELELKILCRQRAAACSKIIEEVTP